MTEKTKSQPEEPKLKETKTEPPARSYPPPEKMTGIKSEPPDKH